MAMHMYCILFIHSSVDGHLGCFFVLDIVNGAAINFEVKSYYYTLEMDVFITY